MLLGCLTMTAVAITEVKAKLSEYLARVRGGEEVVITDRGRPIARLTPVAGRDPHLADLERRGLLRAAEAPLTQGFDKRPRPRPRGATVLDALLEERGEGR